MSALLKPTLSRWGASVYETLADIEIEKQALSAFVEVLADYQDAEIIVVHSKQPFGSVEISKAPSCRLVVTTTSGVDHMDTSTLFAHNIRVARMPMVRRDAVVESALAMLLHHNRRQQQFLLDAQENRWTRGQLPAYQPTKLSLQRIAVVGYGVIGSRLCEILRMFGADVVTLDPKIQGDIPQRSMEEIAEWADVVMLCCNLQRESYHLINRAWLEKVENRYTSTGKRLALINTARGALVDIDAALEFLDKKVLSFLGVDVFEREPYPHLSQVLGRDTVIFTPHAAGFHPALATDIRLGLLRIAESYQQQTIVPFEIQEADLPYLDMRSL